MAGTELWARAQQCRAATVRRRAATGRRARVRLEAQPQVARAAAGRPAGAYPGREPSVPVRAGPEPPGWAGGPPPASFETEPLLAAARLPAGGRRQARWQVGRAEAERCLRGQTDPARGERVLPAPRARLPAVGPGPPAEASDDAERCRPMALPAHSAESRAEQPAGTATAAVRSGREPDAAACWARPQVGAARLAELAERAGPAQELAAGPGDAARSGALRPGARALPGGLPAADRARESGRAQGARRERDAPDRQEAAGGAGPAGRHHPTGPGRAGAMERRNCPATA